MTTTTFELDISSLQRQEIGFNSIDNAILDFALYSISNIRKRKELLTVYIQDAMKFHGGTYKTHLISRTGNYASWLSSASIDYGHLDDIADRSVDENSAAYQNYKYSIDTARMILGL